MSRTARIRSAAEVVCSRTLEAKAMMVRDIAFTAYPSNDVAGTRRWYEEKLGLRFAGAYVEDDVEKYNEVHLGNGCFSLMAAEWTSRAPGSASSIYFEVDDVDGMVTSLQSSGVTIDERFEGPVCRQASFCDPEGNKVTFHESRVRSS
jgi:predicted enzyme related to lactoylglutathione lyase